MNLFNIYTFIKEKKYSLLLDISILIGVLFYSVHLFCKLGYAFYLHIGTVLFYMLFILLLWIFKCSDIVSTHQVIIGNRIFTSRLRKKVFQQRRNLFIVINIVLVIILIFSGTDLPNKNMSYSMLIFFLITLSATAIFLLNASISRKFIRLNNTSKFKNYKIYRKDYISKYPPEVLFIRDVWVQSRKNINTFSQVGDIKVLFSDSSHYERFIELLQKNGHYERFKTDMLFKAAVIRKANENSFFQKEFLIKELKKNVKGGHEYLDQPAKINFIYSNKDLAFLDITD